MEEGIFQDNEMLNRAVDELDRQHRLNLQFLKISSITRVMSETTENPLAFSNRADFSSTLQACATICMTDSAGMIPMP